MDSISPQDIIMSLNPEANREKIIDAGEG